jgi:hypothetical protein
MSGWGPIKGSVFNFGGIGKEIFGEVGVGIEAVGARGIVVHGEAGEVKGSDSTFIGGGEDEFGVGRRCGDVAEESWLDDEGF